MRRADPLPISAAQSDADKKQLYQLHQWTAATKEAFTDPDFPPTQRSLGADIRGSGPSPSPSLLSTVVWMRPDDMLRHQRAAASVAWTVFRGRPRAEDINQGSLGVCWALSAMAVCAERPGMVERLFHTDTISQHGFYQVR